MLRKHYYKIIIYIMFCLSGASGLIYEIIWSRKLTLIFGGTVYAVTTILTVFFSGLALGAYWVGREMDRGRNAFLTYVFLEVVIGLFGIFSPTVFLVIEKIYFLLYPAFNSSLNSLTLIRFVLSFIGLLLPTTLMGATLPVLVKLLSRKDEVVAFDAGRLYAVNTLGASLGAILSTIVLIPFIGVNGSLYLAGTINLLIGGCIYILLRDKPYSISERSPKVLYQHSNQQNYILVLFCIAGFISMVYQVAWIRLLIQVTGSTVYTFGLMLSVFIVGLGLGSEVATRYLNRMKSTILALAIVELAASAYSLIGISYFDRLPILFTALSSGIEGFAGFFIIKMLINMMVLFFPTLLFGAAFPLVATVYAQKASRSGGDVGLVYSLNTLGGIFGSFVGGFLLLPWLGTQLTVMIMSMAGMFLAIMISFTLPNKRQKSAIIVSAISMLVMGLILYHPWDTRLMDSAPYLLQYPDVHSLMASKSSDRLMYYKEGVNVNVSVIGDVEAKSISINGKPMATTVFTDVANQYLLGHLPMLLHPHPTRSLVIGLGAGMTFSALTRHGQPADCVEISPEVVEGTRLFSRYNRSVLEQPNANLIFDDGRNYLMTTRKKYDVITEDPLDPFFMGSGYLYDVEHFKHAKAVLRSGGIMCQYLPLYQVGVTEARIIVKSFHHVFPYVTAWFAFNDMLLIGSEKPLKIDLENLKRRMAQPAIHEDLKEIGIDNVYDFLANYLFNESMIPEIGADLPLNTDNYPVIEYMTPRALTKRTERENVPYFLNKRETRFPGIVDFSNWESVKVEEFRKIQAQYYEAQTHIINAHIKYLNNDQRGVLAELKTSEDLIAPYASSTYYFSDMYWRMAAEFLKAEHVKSAIPLLQKALQYRGDFPPILNLYALALMQDGRKKESLTILNKSLNIDQKQIVPRVYLAHDLMDHHEVNKAQEILEGCLNLSHENLGCLVGMARVELLKGQGRNAAKYIELALSIKPDDAIALSFQKQLSEFQRRFPEHF